MNRKSLALLISICASTALYAGALQAATQTPGLGNTGPGAMVGGYKSISIKNSRVQKAAQVAADSLGSKVKTIYHAYSQVVAGTNFKIDFLLTNGQRYEVIVFQDLSSQYRMTSVSYLPSGGAKPTPPPPPAPGVMPGGTGGVSTNDPGVVAAAKFVESRFNRGRLLKIDHASKQIVKGTRYTLDLEFEQGRYDVVVLGQLDGSYAILSTNKHQ